MLSTAAMGVWQAGQRDRGEATDSPSGSRWMQTLAKLPMTRPNASAAKGQSAPGASANAPVSGMRRHARGQRPDVAAEALGSQVRPASRGRAPAALYHRAAMADGAGDAAGPRDPPLVRRPAFVLLAVAA